jgi:hypothetical protein
MSDAGERTASDDAAGDGEEDLAALREAVEERYDFENFGPAEMAEMNVEEWQAAFDPESWITGEALIDRVESDLRTRVSQREVFARIERYHDPPRLLAYAEDSYAMVYPDGSVDGEGTVLRDVKPTVALCSIESYDVQEPPANAGLPDPGTVPEGGNELGNRVLQVIAAVQVLAGLVLLGAGIIFSFGGPGSNALTMIIAGLGFGIIGVILFVVVANARLSDTYRAEEYRERLRGVGLAEGERPEFLPPPPANDGERESGTE